MAQNYLPGPICIRLNQVQLTYTKDNGGTSKLIRKLIDKEMSRNKLISDLFTQFGHKKDPSAEGHR